MTDEAPVWDPKPSERQYYRHRQTSDRGWLVRREGRPAIRYDRGPDLDMHVFNVGDWEPEREALPLLGPSQVSQICFEADKKLCWALGHHDLAKRDWLELTDKQRSKWMLEGPLKASPAYAQRAGLYAAMRAQLERRE